ncbi:MAG: M1 family metallopeptidase [Acidimicrobiales bacterium]
MLHKAAVAVAVVLCLTGLPGVALAGDGRAFSPGSAGAGDPYFPLDGNGGYDVGRYHLDVAYDPSSDRLTGSATITARATKNLSRFNLDLDGLAVHVITVDGKPAQWTRAGGELTVTPKRGLHDGHRFRTVVRYSGVPQLSSDQFGPSGFIHTDDGAVVIGQPHVADTWFPVNDHPRDKAAYTFRITVPKGLEAIANGVLESRRTERGRTTWTWTATEPMASYLATATIGQFDVRSYRTAGIEYWDAYDPDLFTEEVTPQTTVGQIAEASLARQPEIIDFLEDRFGPYPFSAGGGIVDDVGTLFFALENQTRPIYSKYFFFDPLEGDSVVVHELAHQWFGDSLAVRSWRHIWLNEGFATYAEWMWSEAEGLATAQERFDAAYDEAPATDPFWALTIGDPGPDALFDSAVYDRGAMTLHQLRLTVGDVDFHRILRRWAQTRAGGVVTTKAFVELAEQVSGQDLGALFDTWLFTPGRPVLASAQGPRTPTPVQGPPAPATAGRVSQRLRLAPPSA